MSREFKSKKFTDSRQTDRRTGDKQQVIRKTFGSGELTKQIQKGNKQK